MSPRELLELGREVAYPLRCRAGLCAAPPAVADLAELHPGGAALRWAWCLPGDEEPWGWGRTPLEARIAAAEELGRLAPALGMPTCDVGHGYPVAVVAWAPDRSGEDALAAVGLPEAADPPRNPRKQARRRGPR